MNLPKLWAVLKVAAALSLLASAGCSGSSAEAQKAFPDPQAARMAQAILNDDGAKVMKLISNGADVNAIGQNGTSLLEFAVLQDKHAAFEALLNAGADTKHSDAEGETVMHYAARVENPIYLTELLARHVDMNVTASGNRTPLMFTALFNNAPQMHALITAGANLDMAQPNGDTALIIAAESNSFNRVIDLLHAGANPRATHKIQARPDVTFQRFMNITPENVLSADGKREKAEVRAWLTAHNVPVEMNPPR